MVYVFLRQKSTTFCVDTGIKIKKNHNSFTSERGS